jgi:hypothetical protein
MRWIDLKRFALAMLACSVLDGIGTIAGFDRNEAATTIIVVGYVIVAAIRDGQALDATRPEA